MKATVMPVTRQVLLTWVPGDCQQCQMKRIFLSKLNAAYIFSACGEHNNVIGKCTIINDSFAERNYVFKKRMQKKKKKKKKNPT